MDLPREFKHFALGDVLLDTWLEGSLAFVDGDSVAIRGNAVGFFCVWCHCC